MRKHRVIRYCIVVAYISCMSHSVQHDDLWLSYWYMSHAAVLLYIIVTSVITSNNK